MDRRLALEATLVILWVVGILYLAARYSPDLLQP